MADTDTFIGQTLSHYRILEEVGHGGMGVVFRARDEQLERDVAVKILPSTAFANENARKRFRREARVLARLSHPNVAMAFDYGEQEGIDYLVTEYVGGTTLNTTLAEGALPQKTVVLLGIQLAKGLAAAHRAQIIHRDLKPSNLRLSIDGELKILDFGLACLREPVTDLTKTLSQAAPEIAGGTLPYMAPEQIRCEEADSRTDIWGAGAVLYEMATGHRPFPMTSSLKLIEAIQHLDPPAPGSLNRELTPALDAVILKALDKDPDRRYQSASELGVDLARLLPTSEVSGRVSSVEFTRAKKSLSVYAWVLFAVVAFLCTYGGYRLYEKWRDKPLGSHKLLAVLPFDTTGQDEKTNALIIGLTETLAAKLAQTWHQDLQVVSVRDVREQGVKTTEQAFREFGYDLVLEGSAHRVGDQIRVNCSLVDSKTHRQLSARTITADANDALGLEDQVAVEVASLLSAEQNVRTQTPSKGRNRNNPAAYASYLRGRGYLSEYHNPENVELAIAEFRNAIQLDPDDPDPYAALGEAYLLGYQQTNRESDWVNQAQQHCRQSLLVRETAEGRICLGGVYNQTGKYDLAVQEFQKAIQIDPTNEDGLRGEAYTYSKLGKPAEAEAAYQKAISLRPDYWGGYSSLGAFYYDQARYDDAIAQFEKVIQLAPANYRGYSNLGAMYVAQGKYTQALAPLDKSIEIRPNFEAFNNLGNAYFQLRRFSDAANAFQRGLNLDDSEWMLWGNLGDSLYWSGAATAKAIAAYEKAIAIGERKLQVNPKDTTVLASLADYNSMSRHQQKAVEQIEKAIALAPEDGEVRLRAAIVYNQLGDSERCLASLEKAVAVGYSAEVIRDTPDFDRLHGNPRFRALAHLN